MQKTKWLYAVKASCLQAVTKYAGSAEPKALAFGLDTDEVRRYWFLADKMTME